VGPDSVGPDLLESAAAAVCGARRELELVPEPESFPQPAWPPQRALRCLPE
jgi:hypothetical protein